MPGSDDIVPDLPANLVVANAATPGFHFPYRAAQAVDLKQGDLLRKSSEIESILGIVHPHYLKTDYTHFLVLTQSCDLVRRQSGRCKARYITLAAVRPFRTVLARELEGYRTTVEIAGDLCSEKTRTKAEQLLERLFDNNHPEYFYLHEDPQLGLFDRSCAFLRLSIAVRAVDHYETCLNQRILSLSDVFQAKLGWLVGNIYSRVGTEDWVPQYINTQEFRSMVTDTLDKEYRWVPEKILKKLRKLIPDPDAAKKEGIWAQLDGVALQSKRSQLLERLERILGQSKLDPSVQKRILNSVQSDAVISRIAPNDQY